MDDITIAGGGIAGLVAAIACAQAGARVTLHEAHHTLGGRARTTAAPYVAHEGPHAFYNDGPYWRWLTDNDLIGPTAKIGLREMRVTRFKYRDRRTLRTPRGLGGLLARRGRVAPVDEDFYGWAARICGPEAARAAGNALGVVCYDHDPGRLSAAFCWGLLRRLTAPRPLAVRYVRGGWGVMIDRLAARARELGVRIETGSRLTEVRGPTIVATELPSAARLLGDESLSWTSGDCVLLDVGVRAERGDLFALDDLDDAGFLARTSGPDPSLAPAGHSLAQISMPRRPGEPGADATARAERLCELALPGWRDRLTWRRDGSARGRSGALDLPGTTWRDRPAIDRGDGVYLAGDLVAAPGMRGEVAINSALLAARACLSATTAGRHAELPDLAALAG